MQTAEPHYYLHEDVHLSLDDLPSCATELHAAALAVADVRGTIVILQTQGEGLVAHKLQHGLPACVPTSLARISKGSGCGLCSGQLIATRRCIVQHLLASGRGCLTVRLWPGRWHG